VADPAGGDPEVILVATGSEVHVALSAFEQLSAEGICARVVSLERGR
jgi:transketolase